MNKGLILINKPSGYTSRDVVNIVSKTLATKKVGHTGTLDPLATGVLLLCVGRYTKLVPFLTSLDKEYIAQIKLGITTDTLDITGQVIKQEPFHVSENEIKKVLASFIGKYQMEVPKYSAIKVNGKKLYEYARQHEEVKLPIKEVEIYDLKLISFHDDIIEFKAHVSKGTYIRSLIRDIVQKLNTIGTMNSLIRTKQGNFKIEDTISLKDIKEGNYHLLSLKDIFNIPEYQLTTSEYNLAKNGNHLTLNSSQDYLYLTYEAKEVALYKKSDNYYKAAVILEETN